jgi:hypothetical protein
MIADSIIVTLDTYDNQIYAIGKGPTVMTVAAPSTAITLGQSLLLTGTIMDVSPGTQSDNLKLTFPKGVPAVADESMNEWMLHVYKQFEIPNGVEIKGVSIDLWAVDPNGNDFHIGETVSDTQGNFAIEFTPEIPGVFDVYAFFLGSESYYGDLANTGVLVKEAAPGAVSYELYILGLGIAILIVAIVACLLLLRKK